MFLFKNLLKVLVVLVFVLLLVVCGDGEVEDVGEELDEIVIDVGNVVEDVCEDVKEGVDVEDKDC